MKVRPLALLALVLLLSACRPAPPAVEVERARAHIEMLAGTIGSRPVGSPENVRARQYLIAELERLGFVVRVQHAAGTDPTRGLTAPVANIIAVKDGSRRDAIALISHFDSVPEAMGALDAALGVATCLESARQLLTPSLRHSLFVILTDAEEFGLLGARAALNDPEVAGRVRAFLNFDGTGAAGRALLFEVGPGRGTPLDAWAGASASPEGASFTTEIYRRLPNDTDFSIFKRLNASGLNFAAVGDSYAYHTDRDIAGRVSPATLQHMIANTISTVRAIDAGDVTRETGTAPTYFDLGGYGAIVYGQTVALATAVLASVLGSVTWLLLTRRLWRIRRLAGLILTALWALITSAITVGAMVTAVWALRAIRAELTPWYAAPHWFLLLLAVSGVAGAWVALRLAGVAPASVRPVRDPAATWWVTLPIWIGGAIFLQRSAPTAAYLFTLPLLAAGVLLLVAGGAAARLRLASVLVLGVGAFFGLGDLPRLLSFMVPLFGWLPVIAPVWLYPAVLAAAGLLVAPPLAAVLAGSAPRTLTPVRTSALLALVLVFLGFRAVSATAYTADRPERRTVRYVQDDVKGEAWWEVGGLEAAPNLAGDGLAGARWQRVTDAPDTSVRVLRVMQPFVFRTPASPIASAPAEIRSTFSRGPQVGARLELTLVPRENLVIQVVLPPGLVPRDSSLEGSVAIDRWSGAYVAPPASGFTITMTFDSWTPAEPPPILIALTTVGLPGGSGRLKLLPWLPQATATWRPRSVFIVAAPFPQ